MAIVTDTADRRALILDAAMEVISEHGVDAARMADIADAAGVSMGLVQHYFRNRQRLLTQVFQRESQRITETWGSLVAADADPLTRLIEYLRLCAREGSDPSMRSFRTTWSLWLEFWSKANRDEEISSQVGEIYRAFRKPFTDALSEGVETGVFTLRGSQQDSADRIVSLIDGLAVRTLLGEMSQERMLTLLVDGLCAELGAGDHVHERARRLASTHS